MRRKSCWKAVWRRYWSFSLCKVQFFYLLSCLHACLPHCSHLLGHQHIKVNMRTFLCHAAALWNIYIYMCIFMHIISLPEGSIFPKGKICFEHQFSYIYTEVIKAKLWFKSSGYYNETLWALSLSKKKVFLYIHTHTTTHRHKNCPRNLSEGSRNSLCSRKTKYPRALKIILHYFRSILDALPYFLFFHTTNASQSCKPAAPSTLFYFSSITIRFFVWL